MMCATDEEGNPIVGATTATAVAIPAPAAPAVSPATEATEVTIEASHPLESTCGAVRNVLRLVETMKGELSEIGVAVDLYERSLQSATRARRACADSETIVCALLQDVGEVLTATNHGEISAALLRPYVSQKSHWLLSNHEVLTATHVLERQGLNADPDLRDKLAEFASAGIVAGHPWYDAAQTFCVEYDQPSFDPEYKSDSLASFVPLVEEIFDRSPFWWSRDGINMPKKSVAAITAAA